MFHATRSVISSDFFRPPNTRRVPCPDPYTGKQNLIICCPDSLQLSGPAAQLSSRMNMNPRFRPTYRVPARKRPGRPLAAANDVRKMGPIISSPGSGPLGRLNCMSLFSVRWQPTTARRAGRGKTMGKSVQYYFPPFPYRLTVAHQATLAATSRPFQARLGLLKLYVYVASVGFI